MKKREGGGKVGQREKAIQCCGSRRATASGKQRRDQCHHPFYTERSRTEGGGEGEENPARPVLVFRLPFPLRPISHPSHFPSLPCAPSPPNAHLPPVCPVQPNTSLPSSAPAPPPCSPPVWPPPPPRKPTVFRLSPFPVILYLSLTSSSTALLSTAHGCPIFARTPSPHPPSSLSLPSLLPLPHTPLRPPRLTSSSTALLSTAWLPSCTCGSPPSP